MPGRPFLISSLVKGRKVVVWEKEKVFRPKKSRIKQIIFPIQNFTRMSADKRYTWTVSVIAMVDKDEPINGPIMEEAYKEFEDSITSVKNANKDIKFVIYKYDVSSGTAFIRKSRINQNRYQLKTKEKKVVSIADFYTPPYQHLIDFFDEHVSKERIEDDEEHKHFLILWSHAAGFGFLKATIRGKLEVAFSEDVKKLEFEEKIKKMTDRIFLYNFLKSQLSLKTKQVPYGSFTGDSLKKGDLFPINDEQKKAIDDTIKLITAEEFAGIIENGLSNDTVSISTLKGERGKQKIQIMLCLSCYVNMIDTAYALKDLVNIYISPQTHISFFGYNYDQLFKLLSKKPKATEEDISINISHNYLLKYLKPSMKKQNIVNFVIHGVDYKDSVSFAATCLSKCDIIAEKIRNFKMIAESDPIFRDSLQNTRRGCFPLSSNGTQEIGILDYRHYMMEFFHSIFRIDATLFNAFFIDDSYAEGYSITDHNPGILSQKDFIDGEFRTMSPGSFSVFLPNPTPADLEKVLMEIYFKQKSQFLLKSQWDCIIKLVLETNTSFPLC
jgi:hypothetical protein